MDFKLNEEQQLIQDAARDFADRFIVGRGEEADRERKIPDDIFQEIVNAGYLGLLFDPKYGGSGLGADSYVLTLEQFAEADPGVHSCMVLCVMFLECVNLFGSEAQKAKYLPDGIQGKFRGSFAFTEPGTGSDPKQILTTYKKTENRYVINGVKRFISNAMYEGPMICFANNAETGADITAFIFDKYCKGFSRSNPWETLGGEANCVCDLFLDNIAVPEDAVLGKIGGGFDILKGTIAFSKMTIMAQCVGNMAHAVRLAVKYAKEREHRGKPIGVKFPTIQVKLSEISAMHDSAQLLVYRLAQHFMEYGPDDAGKLIAESGMVKGYVSELGVQCCNKAMSVLGAYGVCKEYEIERVVRQAIMYPVVEGVADMQHIMCGAYLAR